MKACPTCGREIADAVSVCDSCEAWATAALAEARPDDGAPQAPDAPPTAQGTAPAAAAKAAPGGRTAASRRQLTFIAAGVGAVAAVALTGFAMSGRGGSAPGASGTVAASAGAAKPASSTAPAPAYAPVPARVSAVQTWNAENRSTWLGNRRRGAAFELVSETVVKTSFGPGRPMLVVRCASQSIEAFVVTGSPMRIEPRVEGKTVTVSMDGEPARTEQWADSDDRTAVFAPDAAAFVQRLRTARTFDFGYSPHNMATAVAQFSVAGIDSLIGAASKECFPRK